MEILNIFQTFIGSADREEMTNWCQKNQHKNLIWLDLMQCFSDIWSTMCTYDGWMGMGMGMGIGTCHRSVHE